MKKFFLTIVVALATVVSVGTQASASTKTYHDKWENTYVKVTKSKGKVSKVTFALTNTKKIMKKFRKTSKFTTTMTMVNGTHAKLIRKNYKGVTTFNGNMPTLSSKRHVSEVQTNPVPGMVEDSTEEIYINTDYFGKYASKNKHMIASFEWWWNTFGDDEPTPNGNAYVYTNGNVKFAKPYFGE